MLELVEIKKDYEVAGEKVHALKGISLNFRKSEFVSILGPSGCGKTTLLNIIGGLDKYTSGDLIIEGTSTKKYGDRDWDTYRNHSIGFIFQSYHLIPHQTVLQNVELALTIAGVSKEERRERAIKALEMVGLGDKIKNRPNQLSGGQAQRVAIARALINDPEIVLADEPTGALDSVTSVQIMELLKEISKERLVIMVTHNPELAEEYSTRIVRLKDGEIIDDSAPFDGVQDSEQMSFVEQPDEPEQPAERAKVNKGRKKQSAMSTGMAFGLSLKNLLSKRKRTAMVAVAGSIGIIGVSMVLAISAGVQGYIRSMEDDMLSGNPISITQSTYDFTTLMALNGDKIDKSEIEQLVQDKKVGVTSLLKTLGTFSTGFERTNQFTPAYEHYLNTNMTQEYIRVLQYKYAFNVVNNIYTDFTVSNNLEGHFAPGDYDNAYADTYNMSVSAIRGMYSAVLSQVEDYKQWGSMISSVATFSEVPDNFDYIMSQYDVIAMDDGGNVVTSDFDEQKLKDTFRSKNTLIMVLDEQCSQDLTLAQYGYFTQDEFLEYAFAGVGSDENAQLVGKDGIPYSKFIGANSKKFTYYPNDLVYTHVTKTKPVRDKDYIEDYITKPEYAFLFAGTTAEEIVKARDEQGNDALKDLLTTVITDNAAALPIPSSHVINATYEDFRLPNEGEDVDAFVANAYSTEYNTKDYGKLKAFSDKQAYDADKCVELGVNLILQKKEDVSYGCLEAGFYYTNALTKHILDTEKDSEIVKYINETDEDGNAVNSLYEVPMYLDYYYVDPVKDKAGEKTEAGLKYYKYGKVSKKIESNSTLMSSFIDTIIGNLGSMGGGADMMGAQEALGADLFGGSETPIAVYIYPVNFETKDKVTEFLDQWNKWCAEGATYTYVNADGQEVSVKLEEANKITYTDTVGLIIDMINTMIQMITIALIAFTALSLIVSTVMIGIITYVSVVERVKEIGILRAVGARKKDIKRLFNAETFIIGLVAGLFGILVTYLLSLVINIIVFSLAGFWGIAALPWWQAAIMVGLSIGLTLISGLIPASAAAKKDPVVALRTE